MQLIELGYRSRLTLKETHLNVTICRGEQKWLTGYFGARFNTLGDIDEALFCYLHISSFSGDFLIQVSSQFSCEQRGEMTCIGNKH